MSVVRKVEEVATGTNDRPTEAVTIDDCGVIKVDTPYAVSAAAVSDDIWISSVTGSRTVSYSKSNFLCRLTTHQFQRFRFTFDAYFKILSVLIMLFDVCSIR